MNRKPSSIEQAASLLAVSIASLPKRRGVVLMILVSTSGAVAVLTSMLAMVQGLLTVATGTGKPDRAYIISADAQTEVRSSLSADVLARIENMPGIARDHDGAPLVSAESVLPGEVQTDAGKPLRVPLRGIGPTGFKARSEVRILEGRAFTPGLREVLVGRMAQIQYPSLQVGNSVRIYGAEWLITGAFDAGGSLHESEFLADRDTLNATYHRNQIHSATVQLESAAAYPAFEDEIAADSSLQLSVSREADHYAQQAKGIRRVLTFVAYFVGVAMALGGTLAAVNAMYTSVRRRSIEIATLRALGFESGGILGSVLLEAVLLSAIGGLVGITIASVFVDGAVASTVRDGSSELMFMLSMTPAIAGLGLAWACGMGFFGGLLPAWRAVRISPALALRMA